MPAHKNPPLVFDPVVREIRSALEELGWTQHDLCRAAGISDKHLSQLLNGKTRVSCEVALRLEYATSYFINAQRLLYAQSDRALQTAREADQWLPTST